MKLTKKNFAPNLELKVLNKPISFVGAIIDKLEGFEVGEDLSLLTQNRWFNTDDLLITDKIINVGGSVRCIFHVKGEIKQYQSFWFEFTNLTILI